jgi:uncharacterized delta-60 repeat protein
MKNYIVKALFLTAVFLITSRPTISFSKSGSLDNTFGNGGKLITSLGNFGDRGNSLVIQSDQKIVLGGYSQSSFTASDFALLRCNTDGTLDTTFGIGGKVITTIENRSEGSSVAIQADDKILLGGSSYWFINLARYNNDGNLDTTFGAGGIVITDVDGYYSEKCKSMAIQSDGKILLGGYGQHNANDNSYLILVRYNTDGSLDTTFGTAGIVIGREGRGYSINIQNDGKILLGGSSGFKFALVRYNSNGTLDNSFGIGGEVLTLVDSSGEANSISIQGNDKIVLGGYCYNTGINSGFALVRFNTDGTLDNSFGVGGIVKTYIGSSSCMGNSLYFQVDGKILLAGKAVNGSSYSDFALVRYDSIGTLDNSFGIGGMVTTPIGSNYSSAFSLSIQTDSKIVLGGYAYNGSKTNMALVRYNADSISDISEITGNRRVIRIYPNPFNASATIQFNALIHNAEITIYNVFGQELKKISNISEHEIQISRNNLPSGMYFLQLTEGNKITAIDKLVINE